MRLPLTVCAIAVLLLAGCATQSERAYYQTRYLPTEGGDVLYSAPARATWRGDREVYQLPDQPPAIDEQVAQRECEPPGAQFKPQTLVGYHDEHGGNSEGQSGAIAAFDPRPVPVSPLGPDYVLPISSQRDEDHGDALVNDILNPIADLDQRPRSRTGAGLDTDHGPVHGRMRDADKWDYCLDPEIAPAASAPLGGRPTR